MIIDYIQLNNFLSHKDTEIRFEKGINIIYGKNGAGKSSIVDAIRFALFGEKRGDKIAELIRSKSTECSVTIGFRLNDRYYEVYRNLGLSKSGNITKRDAWIRLDGSMIAETFEGISNEIEKGLQIPKDIFLNSVFVRQGEMDSLISGAPRDREMIFSKIIGIDILSENAKKIKTIRDDLRLEEVRFSDLDARMERILVDLKGAEKEVRDSQASIMEMRNSERSLEEEVEASDGRRNEALQRKASFDSLSSRTKELEERIAALKKDLESNRQKLGGISFSESEREELLENPLLKKKTEISRYLRIEAEARSISASITNVKEALEAYEKDRQRFEELEEYHRQYKGIEEELETVGARVQDLQGSRSLQTNLEDELRVDRQKLKILSEKIVSHQYDGLRGLDRTKLSEKRGDLERKIREVEGKKNALKERLGGLNNRLAELRKNKDTLGDKRTCPVCGSVLDGSHLREIHERYLKDEQLLVDESVKIADQAAELSRTYSSLDQELDFLSKSETEDFLKSTEELGRIRERISERESKLGEISEQLEKLSSAEKEQSSLREKKSKLEKSEREYISLSFSLDRTPVEKFREKQDGYERDLSRMKGEMEKLSLQIGFAPRESSLEEVQEIERKLDSIRKSESEYNLLKTRIEAAEENIGNLREEHRRNSGQLSSYGNISEELSTALREYSERQAKLTELRNQIAALKERKDASSTKAEKLKDDISNLEGERARLELLKEAGSKLDKLRTAFDRNGIQSLIRKDSSVSINNMTRNYLSSFNFEFDDVRIDENFDIKVINNGIEEPLDSLSGGERISLAIAVRLAIARYLTGRVSTVIMDEPTNFLDEDRRGNLKDIIQYSLKDENMVQQMIMITHHAELTSAADSTYEVTKSGGISQITQG